MSGLYIEQSGYFLVDFVRSKWYIRSKSAVTQVKGRRISAVRECVRKIKEHIQNPHQEDMQVEQTTKKGHTDQFTGSR